jgi:hypothetical protein
MNILPPNYFSTIQHVKTPIFCNLLYISSQEVDEQLSKAYDLLREQSVKHCIPFVFQFCTFFLEDVTIAISL